MHTAPAGQYPHCRAPRPCPPPPALGPPVSPSLGPTRGARSRRVSEHGGFLHVRFSLKGNWWGWSRSIPGGRGGPKGAKWLAWRRRWSVAWRWPGAPRRAGSGRPSPGWAPLWTKPKSTCVAPLPPLRPSAPAKPPRPPPPRPITPDATHESAKRSWDIFPSSPGAGGLPAAISGFGEGGDFPGFLPSFPACTAQGSAAAPAGTRV